MGWKKLGANGEYIRISAEGVMLYFRYCHGCCFGPRGLRCGSAAFRLLGSWVRILNGAWIFVSCGCCVLSGRGLCVGLITRPEESYRLCVCLIVCDLETSAVRRPGPDLGCCASGKESCFGTRVVTTNVSIIIFLCCRNSSLYLQNATLDGRAMAQAVSRRPPTAEAWVRSRVSPCGICVGQSGTGTGFFPEYFGFPLSISFHRCSITRKRTKNNNHRVAQ
jgi:hypothetical protein